MPQGRIPALPERTGRNLESPRIPAGLPGTGKHFLHAWPRCRRRAWIVHHATGVRAHALEGAVEYLRATLNSQWRTGTLTGASCSATPFSSGDRDALPNAEPRQYRSTDGVPVEYRWSADAVLVKCRFVSMFPKKAERVRVFSAC